jgi:hypothetical protein
MLKKKGIYGHPEEGILHALELTGGWLGVVGLGVGGLGVEGLSVGGLGVGVKRASSCQRGLSRAMVLHVTKSVVRPLRYSAFLSVRTKFIFGTQSAVSAPPNRLVADAAPGSRACVRRGQPNGGLGCGSSWQPHAG